jgi:hypothetical protein
LDGKFSGVGGCKTPHPCFCHLQKEILNHTAQEARKTRDLMRQIKEDLMGAVADAVSVLNSSVDAASASGAAEIARLEALILTLQSSPDDPAVVAAVQAAQVKVDALKAALDAERP